MARNWLSRMWGAGGGGSTPAAPAVPTFTVADNGDGSGGVVTVAGSTAGSTNTFYAAERVSGAAFSSLGSRTGDGTIAIAPGDGGYWGYVRSVLNSQQAQSLVLALDLTSPSADAQIIQLADAIVTSLNLGSFATSFTAARALLPVVTREDLDDVNVLVVPRAEETVRDSRTTWRSDYRIDVGIRQHVANDAAAPAALARLAEQIFDFFRVTKPSGRYEALITRDWPDVLAMDQLKNGRIFGAVQTLSFRGWRT